MKAEDIIRELGLEPHPEGGWFAETYRHAAEDGSRGASTAIYYLLRAGESSHWHRVKDADEVWHWYAGEPLSLRKAAPEGGAVEDITLGPDIAAGQRPQAVIPADWWQAARPLGAWVLVGCTVAPAFEFSAFEMAPEGWSPDGSAPD